MKHFRRFAMPVALLAVAGVVTACASNDSTGTAPSDHADHNMTSMPDRGATGGMADMNHTTDTGATATSGGFTLRPATTTAPLNQQTTLRFRIDGPAGKPVTDYVVDQTKKLHLYVIRADLTGYQHLHPSLAEDGTWSTPIAFAQPGSYRVIADFTVRTSSGDMTHVLGVPLTVPGRVVSTPLPVPASTATVDGYTLAVSGALHADRDSPLSIAITRGGRTVTDVEPYLGVWAHLSAFRQGSLAFTHLHPNQQPMAGMQMDSPDPLTFTAHLSSSGSYRVFIQFRAGGELHTGAVTLNVS